MVAEPLEKGLGEDIEKGKAGPRGTWDFGKPLYQQEYMFGYLQDGFGPEKWGIPKSNTQSLLIIIR